MGWTSYRATHYKNGKIDRKAECDAYFLEGLNRGHFDVIKSSMVGSTYYAAIKPLKRGGAKDENGKYIYVDIPEEEQYVFAVVFLTSTDMKDYFNFSYKDMDESMGPYQYDCPKGILDVLTPTENEMANEWRKLCYENLKAKRNPNGLNKLPVGSVIKIKLGCDTKYRKAGDEVLLTKTLWPGRKRNRTYWMNGRVYYTPKFIGDNYEIVKRG